MPAGDTDSDGDTDAADITQIDTWIAGTIYAVRGDLDLDGDVDAADKAIAVGTYQGTTLGRGSLSSHGNRLRWAGMQDLLGAHTITHVRHRAYSAELGRWSSRDPFGYLDGLHLMLTAGSMPIGKIDPFGLHTMLPGASGTPGGVPAGPPDPYKTFSETSTRATKIEVEKGSVPDCPENESTLKCVECGSQFVGDNWCYSPDDVNTHPGAANCYRSYGTGTEGGQQCCYNGSGEIIRSGPGAGTFDIAGPANGEEMNGSNAGQCKWDSVKLMKHFVYDVVPWQQDKAHYNRAHQYLRDKGVPTGTSGSSPWSDGISDVGYALQWAIAWAATTTK